MPGYVEDTIAAIATAPGIGAISVIRVSGRDARAIVGRILRPAPARAASGTPAAIPGDIRSWGSHRACLATLVDPGSGSPIDRALVLPMLAPRSYTGEDVVELHCHGGRLVPERALRALLAAGARGARPGEFTERAFLNGKLDLCQAEAVADLIEATSDAGHSAAWHQLDGTLSRAINVLHEQVLDARALVEAHLDFPEDDLPASSEQSIAGALDAAARSLRTLSATYERGRLARDGLRVVLAGKPNVGKSSLMNALLGRERALVSHEAGTTRDYLEEPAALGKLQALLCDTAGIREAGGETERAGIRLSEEQLARADVIVVVLDCARPLDQEDAAVLRTTAASTAPIVVALNKIDLAPAFSGRELLLPGGLLDPARFASPDPTVRVDSARRREAPSVIPVSATGGQGIAALAAAVHETLAGTAAEPLRETLLVTRARQHAALERSTVALEEARAVLVSGGELEVVACELQLALVELEAIVGLTSTEEVLDRIFSKFCIGK